MVKILDEGFAKARSLPPTRLAAARLPKPARKPDLTNIVLASLRASAAQEKPEAALYSASQDTGFVDEMLGQGDIDPDAANRLETGLIAIAAHTGRRAQIAGVGQYGAAENMIGNRWAIQIGAYSSEKISDQAIRVASKSLPPELRQMARSNSMPLTTGSRTIYRARIEGFDETTAQKACAYLRNCMVIAP